MLTAQQLRNLFNIAREERQNGDVNRSITSYYISIYEDNSITGSDTVLRAITGNPKYIIGHTVHNYEYFGRRKDAKIFGYINSNGDLINGIYKSKWILTDFKMFQVSFIESATFKLISNSNEEFEFHFDSSTPFKSIQLLWDLFVEIDDNCDTVKEAKLYYEYFLKKLELQDMTLSMDNYRQQITNQNDLIIQHESLLNVIKNLINQS